MAEYLYKVVSLLRQNEPLEIELNRLGKKGFKLMTPKPITLPQDWTYSREKLDSRVLIMMKTMKNPTTTP
jgi:hypothetical protein